jgi:hypothetical protein
LGGQDDSNVGINLENSQKGGSAGMRRNFQICCLRIDTPWSLAENNRPLSTGESMQEQLKNRLEELKEEFERGKKRLEALDAEANELRQTLLRISGAIQVLQEELKKSSE